MSGERCLRFCLAQPDRQSGGVPGLSYIRERTALWHRGRSLREQEQWDEHAAFMDALAAENFLVLSGPLGNGRDALFFIQAESEEEINARLADDPWTQRGLLRTVTIELWEILLGKERAASVLASPGQVGERNGLPTDALADAA